MGPRQVPQGVRRRVWPSGKVTYETSWFDAAKRRHSENFDTVAEADNNSRCLHDRVALAVRNEGR
jgi:hypothetical protein